MSSETVIERSPVSAVHPETRVQVLEALRNFGEKTHTFEAGQEGPSVLLVGGMHGNEILGVLVAEMFRREFESGSLRLISGTFRLMLGNPRAIEANGRTAPGRPDMNRILRTDLYENGGGYGWEGRHAARIMNAARASDITIDLHSTNNPSPAFVCASSSPRHREIYRWLRREAVVTDPRRLVSKGGGSLDEFADDCGKIGICYESGQALDVSNVLPVFEMVKAVLISQGMVEGTLPEPENGSEYEVSGFVPYVPGQSFTFAEGKERGFAPIENGACIGYRAGEAVCSEVDGIILFPKKPEHQAYDGAVAYLARRIND